MSEATEGRDEEMTLINVVVARNVRRYDRYTVVVPVSVIEAIDDAEPQAALDALLPYMAIGTHYETEHAFIDGSDEDDDLAVWWEE